MNMTSAWAKGEEFALHELGELARNGKIRIPEFQRSFRWESSDVQALFDSLLRGYPIGSVLLWNHPAEAATVHLGALEFDVPAVNDALWVIDGQQRITSLVNAISADSFEADSRFRLVYSFEDARIKRPHDARGELAIPLPDLYDVPRAMAWAVTNDVTDRLAEIGTITQFLRDIRVPASVVRPDASMEILREIFDRMNSSGKKLRGAEIFDAMNRSLDGTTTAALATGAIADRLAGEYAFGAISEDTVFQAILVRRHPDYVRDAHGEFGNERRTNSDFPDETQADAYRGAEEALRRTIDFLVHIAEVPHTSMLPYRNLLLVLVRFFSFHPSPSARNSELLSQWYWRAALAFLTSRTASVPQTGRTLAGQIDVHDEDASIRQLLTSVSGADRAIPDVVEFRANTAVSQLQLCAYWDLQPVDATTLLPIRREQLAAALGDHTTATPAVPQFAPRAALQGDFAKLAARLMSPDISGTEALARLGEVRDSPDGESALQSHLLERGDFALVDDGRWHELIERRTTRFEVQSRHFFTRKCAWAFEATPTLDALDLDEAPAAAGPRRIR